MSSAAKCRMHVHDRRKRFHLPVARIASRKDFLQGDDVGIEPGQYIGNALDGDAAINAAGLVNVIRDDDHVSW